MCFFYCVGVFSHPPVPDPLSVPLILSSTCLSRCSSANHRKMWNIIQTAAVTEKMNRRKKLQNDVFYRTLYRERGSSDGTARKWRKTETAANGGQMEDVEEQGGLLMSSSSPKKNQEKQPRKRKLEKATKKKWIKENISEFLPPLQFSYDSCVGALWRSIIKGPLGSFWERNICLAYAQIIQGFNWLSIIPIGILVIFS